MEALRTFVESLVKIAQEEEEKKGKRKGRRASAIRKGTLVMEERRLVQRFSIKTETVRRLRDAVHLVKRSVEPYAIGFEPTTIVEMKTGRSLINFDADALYGRIRLQFEFARGGKLAILIKFGTQGRFITYRANLDQWIVNRGPRTVDQLVEGDGECREVNAERALMKIERLFAKAHPSSRERPS